MVEAEDSLLGPDGVCGTDMLACLFAESIFVFMNGLASSRKKHCIQIWKILFFGHASIYEHF
jgi:hypothetical protein